MAKREGEKEMNEVKVHEEGSDREERAKREERKKREEE